MRLRAAVVLALGLAMAACGGSAGQKYGKADAETIRQRTEEFRAAFNGKDLPKLVDFYSENTILMPPNSATVQGKELVQGFYRIMLDGGAGELQLETKELTGEGAMALQRGSYAMTTRPATGPEVRDRGKYLFVFRNTAGQWRCEYTMWSSDLPVPAPAPAATAPMVP